VKLSYDNKRSLIDIKVDADQVDLTNLFAYPAVEDGGGGTAPVVFYLGGEYFAKGDLEVNCQVNGKITACHFR
jgi:hypothetical protein